MHILVSACLLGKRCRWHNRPVRPSAYVSKFIAEHPDIKIISVCPEELGGLPTPRPPVKVRKGRAFETCEDKAKRDEVTGRDITDAFQAGAEATLAIAQKHDCRLAILFRTSPSCSKSGFTGRLLTENGIEVVSTF